MGMEDDFLLEDEDDEKTIEFIKNYLPQDLKEKFTDDDLYYILDLIVDYYTTSGCLDAQPDEEGYINIDQDEIVNYIVKEAAKDGPYLSLDDFRQRTKVSKTVIEFMSDLGLFGNLPQSNQLSLFDF